ncbi:hypothetical protein KAFR_0H02320 [Kazachstania africana CBS 2517]|uniref:Uncharacterized protein n=1 Tax=Kazachstania africana (strain ATCC 22294 / BCRC 22015 / CBS 2517 / CECT 1963 / NBRC 1671 / NRRL Y-8276) TaxID=1071382 RepID=H2AZ85_KAZAF|nr:hypothetical protein KAFR_0H02320 [Kazachstania africana CBS 2517]CCF59641.1 hypothetical protein KAFR_0H02320 [Kazachstania africana CBS 2517]
MMFRVHSYGLARISSLCQTTNIGRFYSKNTSRRLKSDTNSSIEENLRVLFDPDRPRDASVRSFKILLKLSAESKLVIEKYPRYEKLLKTLSTQKVKSQASMSTIARKLYTLAVQRRISDEDIYSALLKVLDEDIINVLIPKVPPTGTTTSTNKTRKPVFDIGLHPENTDYLDVILEQLEKNTVNTNDLYQIISNIIEESNEREGLQPNEKGNTKDINLNSLKNYLHEIDIQNTHKNLFLTEQKKTYDWNRPKEPLHFSGGNILFDSVAKTNVKLPISKLQNKAIDIIFNLPPRFGKNKRKCLLFNLKDQKSSIEKLELNDRSLDIVFQGHLGIINASQIQPEYVKQVINDVEKKGWNAAGFVKNNPEMIIFFHQMKTNLVLN